jgi:hypothetical protein
MRVSTGADFGHLAARRINAYLSAVIDGSRKDRPATITTQICKELFPLKQNDGRYLDLVLEPIRVCAKYKPKFGQGAKGDGLTLIQFQTLYQGDPFYSWFGLDNPMMYAAHKAAGGMTSVYRQIGIGCEKLFRTVLKDSLGLSASDVTWSYEIPLPSGKTRKR